MTIEEFNKELDKTFPLNKASERANSWNCDRQIGANWAFELLYKPLPPAEGAEQLLKRKYADDKWEPNFNGIVEVMREFAAQQQPTAEGAEECTCQYEYNDDHHGLLVWQCPKCERAEQPTADGAEEMKEHIIHILQTHISAIQLCNDDDPIEIVGINTAADEIIKIADKMVSERLREELIKYDEWMSDNRWGKDEILTPEESCNEYLKSRDSDE